ncbi:unnamed protein product [Rhizoctonia solani]|uniref:CFEM domain-containing protein n=1 Tax=Rhizoctonia solani TaxID=456999 RepID=A0A8H2WFA9_9AGAM|nr:unnamed protein product [Rhizoctonia solani]
MRLTLVVTALLASYVAAQSVCITNCATQAAAANCGGLPFTNPSCACQNANFQQAALQCLEASCPPEDKQVALQLLQQMCSVSLLVYSS